MNIKRENIGQLNELITIELEASDYQEKVSKSLKDLKRRANIPGFRQGYAPMGMIEKMYKKSLIAEEVSKMTNDEIYKYLTDNKLNILFEPIAHEDKTAGDFENAGNFSFTFEIGLRPDFTVNYADAKNVPLYKVIATEAEIDKEVMELRKRAGKFSSTEEVVEDDMLLVTVKPDSEAEEFTSSLPLSYVKDSELKSFIGKKLHAEMDVDTAKVFKSDYERSTFLKIKTDELENSAKKVHIKIDAIHHRELAEMNEAFFLQIFPDESVKDETALRQKIKAQIESRHETETNAVFRNKVLDILMEKTVFELPDDFIKRYLSQNGGEYTAESIEEKYNDIRKSIAYQLLENQITQDCNIHVDQNDVLKYIESYVRLNYFGTLEKIDDEMEKQVASLVQTMLKNQENVKNTSDNLFFGQMTEGFKEKISPKSKEISFEDLIAELTNKKTEKPKSAPKKEAKPKEEKEEKGEEVKKEDKPKTTKPRTKKENS